MLEVVKKVMCWHDFAALQEERKRYLEEKSVLRTIYDRLKKEIARSEQLEETIAAKNQENNKLTVTTCRNLFVSS